MLSTLIKSARSQVAPQSTALAITRRTLSLSSLAIVRIRPADEVEHLLSRLITSHPKRPDRTISQARIPIRRFSSQLSTSQHRASPVCLQVRMSRQKCPIWTLTSLVSWSLKCHKAAINRKCKCFLHYWHNMSQKFLFKIVVIWNRLFKLGHLVIWHSNYGFSLNL